MDEVKIKKGYYKDIQILISVDAEDEVISFTGQYWIGKIRLKAIIIWNFLFNKNVEYNLYIIAEDTEDVKPIKE